MLCVKARAVLVWLSNTAVFVLVGIAITVQLNNLVNRDWRKIALDGTAFIIWAVSFVCNCQLILSAGANSNYLNEY